jgi:hypothetical protein
MTKLITRYPIAVVVLIWAALIAVMCFLPGTDALVAQHGLAGR